MGAFLVATIPYRLRRKRKDGAFLVATLLYRLQRKTDLKEKSHIRSILSSVVVHFHYEV